MKSFLKKLNRIINDDSLSLEYRYEKASRYVCYSYKISKSIKESLCKSLVDWYRKALKDKKIIKY